jgi:hypothetical protein
MVRKRKKTNSERLPVKGMYTIDRFIREMEESEIKTQKDLFECLRNNWPKNELGYWECEVCGEPVLTLNPHNFAHVAPKGTYPEFKLRAKNIALVCFTHHFFFDQLTDKGIQDPRFEWMFALRRQIERQAYRLKNILKLINYAGK